MRHSPTSHESPALCVTAGLLVAFLSLPSPAEAGCCGSKVRKQTGYSNSQAAASSGAASAVNQPAAPPQVTENYGPLPLVDDAIYSNAGLALGGNIQYDHNLPENPQAATLGEGAAATATGTHVAPGNEYGVVQFPAGQGEGQLYDAVDDRLMPEEADMHYGPLEPEQRQAVYGDLPPEEVAAGEELAAQRETAAAESASASLATAHNAELAEAVAKRR